MGNEFCQMFFQYHLGDLIIFLVNMVNCIGFLKFYLLTVREKGRGERHTHQFVVPLVYAFTG